MAIYRKISMSFWEDPKIVDDFTPEDRYFYLYLFTNPHTNLSGCYEISFTQMANETGYNKDSIERLVRRFVDIHKIIQYSPSTKEILLLNWHKYNWTSSEKFRKPLMEEIRNIKNTEFKNYLVLVCESGDTVSIPYPYRIDTTVTDTDTVSVSVTDTVSDKKKIKHRYGEYNNVLLTDEEYQKLQTDFPDYEEWIQRCSEYVASTGRSYKSHYATIRKWIRKEQKEQKQPSKRSQEFTSELQQIASWAERGENHDQTGIW